MFRHFRRGGLRVWILSMIKQSPKNGAEIMDQIEIASQGWWRPSPGSVYPMLDQLAREGFIRKREDGKYEIIEKELYEPYWSPWENYTKTARTPEEIIADVEINIAYLEDKVRIDKTSINNFAERLQNIRDHLDKIIQEK